MSSITREAVLEMPLADIFAAIKDPKTSGEMQALMRDRQIAARISQLMLEQKNREEEVDRKLALANPPSTEELAAQASEVAGQPPVEPPVVTPAAEVPPAPVVAPVVDHTEEDAAWRAEGVLVQRDAAGKIVRLVQEYQVRDDDNTAIGRPTHLEARTAPELVAKQRVAHENATRAFNRLKKQKTTFQEQPKTILTPEQIKAAAEAALAEKDPAKVTDVIRATIEAQYAAKEQALRDKEAVEAGKAISNEFMRRHLSDYFPCEANQKAINDYLVEHRMNFTLDNLEACFADLMDQGNLVTVPAKVAVAPKPVEPTPNPTVTTTVNVPADSAPVASEPVAVTPTVVAEPVVAPSQPAVQATVSTPVAANQPTTTRRPGVNGSLPPGTLSAKRPDVVDPSAARKEFMRELKNMKPEIMKSKLKNDPQFVKQLQTYGIRIQ